MSGKLCDDCLQTIMFNLSRDDIGVLNALKALKTANQLMAVNKTKIMPKVEGITEFKFQTAVSRLELAGLVGRNPKKRPASFYITPSGKRILELWNKSMKEFNDQ